MNINFKNSSIKFGDIYRLTYRFENLSPQAARETLAGLNAELMPHQNITELTTVQTQNGPNVIYEYLIRTPIGRMRSEKEEEALLKTVLSQSPDECVVQRRGIWQRAKGAKLPWRYAEVNETYTPEDRYRSYKKVVERVPSRLRHVITSICSDIKYRVTTQVTKRARQILDGLHKRKFSLRTN